jgi:hypothetical protein
VPTFTTALGPNRIFRRVLSRREVRRPSTDCRVGVSSTIEPVAEDPPAAGRRSVLRQQWAELAYFHWAYEPEVVQQRLPAGVTVDTFDGSAWVGLIPFEMRDVQLGPTSSVVLLPRRTSFDDRCGCAVGLRSPVLLGTHHPRV